MSEPNLTAVDKFIKETLSKKILDRYMSFQIISERDLQSHVSVILYDYFKKTQNKPELLNILTEPHLKELGLKKPDIVVFRHRKPWIAIELKEKKKLKLRTAENQRERLLRMRDIFPTLKRGYLLYVARKGTGKMVKGFKNEGRYFCEIPIVLATEMNKMDKEELRSWERQHKYWDKYSKSNIFPA